MRPLSQPFYQTKSAVLFLIFNRPQITFEVFEQIRIAKPPRLYIAADGPRPGNQNDRELCGQARSVIEKIDWDCKLKTLFNVGNAGCKDNVSGAITWFFENEQEGIILEDDCFPANGFFLFCDTLLDKYRNDTRVRHITGCNFQKGVKHGSGSYYFSYRTHVWGWASWRRVWKDYDKSLGKYSCDEIAALIQDIYNDPFIVEGWVKIFNEVKSGKINSWAYPLDFSNFFNKGLVIIPNENLIQNIGFGADATHTNVKDNFYGNNPLQEITEVIDPLSISPEKQADLFILNYDFHVEERRKKENSLGRKIIKSFKAMFRHAAL